MLRREEFRKKLVRTVFTVEMLFHRRLAPTLAVTAGDSRREYSSYV